MIFVITGDGKGKTSASMGMLARALGNGMKCAVLQFIKSNPKATGEYSSFKKLGVEWENWGNGFTWEQKDSSVSCAQCNQGWRSFTEKAKSGTFDFIVLDEFTYVLENRYLDEKTVLEFLKNYAKGSSETHVVITGRRADEALTELADTVSEIREIKHHFNSNGNKAIKGIEY